MGFKIPNFYTQNNSPLKADKATMYAALDKFDGKYDKFRNAKSSLINPDSPSSQAMRDAYKADWGKPFDMNDEQSLSYANSYYDTGNATNALKASNPNLSHTEALNQMETARENSFGKGNENTNAIEDMNSLDAFVKPASTNTSKVKWSEAPGVGTAERTAWYVANNLKLDHTTPEKVKEPVVDEIVNEEETEVIAEERKPLNRRQRRAFNIEAKNDARRLKRMGTSEEEIREGVKDNSFVIPEGDFQDPNIA